MAAQTRVHTVHSAALAPDHGDRWYRAVAALIKLSGLYGRGWRNAHAIADRRLVWPVPGLPEGLHGLRILFLSDLHLDGPSLTTECLRELLPGIEADLVILGGDYRWHTHGFDGKAAAEFRRLAPALRAPLGVLGILGNHDEPTFLEVLAEAGVTVLANDAVAVRRNGAELWVVGLEDSCYFLRHDFEKALRAVPAGVYKLLVPHGLETVHEAARRGFALCLAGHTHWGQIALPGGVPIITHCRAGRRCARGFWQVGDLRGYTSSGAGVCGMPLRFNTRGEVVTLELRQA